MLASMARLLLLWLINALALLALPYLVPSVQVDSFTTALVSWAASALVFGPPRVVVVRRDEYR